MNSPFKSLQTESPFFFPLFFSLQVRFLSLVRPFMGILPEVQQAEKKVKKQKIMIYASLNQKIGRESNSFSFVN